MAMHLEGAPRGRPFFSGPKSDGLLFQWLAKPGPSRDAGKASLLVDPFGESGDADRSEELTVEPQRHTAADQINLAGIHAHDAEIAVRTGLGDIRQGLRGLAE